MRAVPGWRAPVLVGMSAIACIQGNATMRVVRAVMSRILCTTVHAATQDQTSEPNDGAGDLTIACRGGWRLVGPLRSRSATINALPSQRRISS
jgi:hypothetical protein